MPRSTPARMRIVVKLTLDDEHVMLSVADNGRGFEMPQSVPNLATGGRLGLLGMRERASLAGGTCGCLRGRAKERAFGYVCRP